MNAWVIKNVSNKAYIKEHCVIAFKNLPKTDSLADRIYSAMTFLDERIDLAGYANVILLIPTSSISYRNIKLPLKLEKKIRQILPYEIGSLLPDSDRKYLTDFCIVDMLDREDHLNVFTASATESDIESYVSVLGEFGVKTTTIIPKGNAIINCLIDSYPKIKHFVCLNFGNNKNTLILVYNHTPVTIHSFPVSQSDNHEIDKIVNQALIGFRQNFNIKASFNFFITSDKDIDEFLNLTSRFECLLAEQNEPLPSDNNSNIICNLEQVNTTELILEVPQSIHTKSQINYCKLVEKKTDSSVRDFLKQYALSILLGSTLLILIFFSLQIDINHLNKKINLIKNRSIAIVKTTFPEEKSIKFPLLQMKSLIKEADKESISIRNTQQFPESKAINILTILSESIPASIDIEISNLVINQTDLIITGMASTYNTVDKLKENIETTELFKTVLIKNASINNKSNNVLFNLVIQL